MRYRYNHKESKEPGFLLRTGSRKPGSSGMFIRFVLRLLDGERWEVKEGEEEREEIEKEKIKR